MDIDFWLPIVLKALTTAGLVVSASMLAEAAGPFWGALIACLPVSAGPAFVFLAMRHGRSFVAESALASFTANAAIGGFLIVFALLARTAPLMRSLAAALMVWTAIVFAFQAIGVPLAGALLLNLLVYAFGLRVLTRGVASPPTSNPPARWRSLDLLLRAAFVAAFVSLLVAISAALGPVATGALAVFPVSLTSLLAIVHRRAGGLGASALATAALWPMLGFGMALMVLHLAVAEWGLVPGLVASLSASILWSACLLALRLYRARRRTQLAD
jgi:hypothetical protein